MVASRLESGDVKKKALIWFILAIVLIFGVTRATFTGEAYDTPSLMAIIATEFATLLAITFAIFKPKAITVTVALISSIIWLVNQEVCWAMYTPLPETLPTQMYMFTAVMNTVLLAISGVYVMFKFKAKEDMDLQMGQPKMLLMLTMVVMIIYSFHKTYLDFMVAGGLAGVTWALSGGLWALGILLISFATLWSIMSPTKQRSMSTTTMIAVIGLMLSAIAALAWGTALTIFWA